ncbi:DUF4279 domain-containing protein, partial [Candidatus Albibeggiatoa sp. nov. BB20]|uniref:DUF4279 domain-containing protein n=1 Tax=Candidatus Albibeggiatoa sp. nov. BB20 TaxID=3162723 RepID=UPI00336535AF
MNTVEYYDDYPSCEHTYLTLRFYHEILKSSEVTHFLGIKPDWEVEKNAHGKRKIPKNGWFLTTKDIVKSKDCRRHIQYILRLLEGKQETIE